MDTPIHLEPLALPDYGDIIGVQGSGWLSDNIRSATGNGPLSHIAICTATSPFPQVTEALYRLVTRSWQDRLSDAVHVWILKSPLTPDQRQDGCRLLLKHSGEEYGYEHIALEALDEAARTTWFTDHFAQLTNHRICSEWAAFAEPLLGLEPGPHTSPNDFWGWWQVERWQVIQVQ